MAAGEPRARRKRKDKPTLTEQVEASAERVIERRPPIDTSILIPSGSTLLNCACSDNPHGAFALGRIVTLPGGSVGGKTMLALTMMAECAVDSRFDKYDLIYDDGEEALAMDIPYLFGNKFNERIKPPKTNEEGESVHSETIQDFKANILNRCTPKTKKIDNEWIEILPKPFIYVLDSLDSLTTDEELKKEYAKAIAKATSAEAVKELKGSYKTEKAKHLGEAIRMINGMLKKTKSALFLVQQIRDKIGVTFGKQTTTSGGHAPFFYSTHQVWFTKLKNHTRTIKSFKRKIGSHTQAEVTKNKITGKMRDIEFDIYYDYGIDDVTSCVNFLIQAGHWKKRKETIVAHDLDLEAGKSGLVKSIEENRLERKLQVIIGQVWNEVEETLLLDRSRRFGK